MKHKAFRLSSGWTYLGLEASDYGMSLGTWMVTLQVLNQFAGPRTALLWSLVAGIAGFFIWMGIKHLLPPKFFTDLITYFGEADVYRVTPDVDAVPLVVEVEKVREAERRDRNVSIPPIFNKPTEEVPL